MRALAPAGRRGMGCGPSDRAPVDVSPHDPIEWDAPAVASAMRSHLAAESPTDLVLRGHLWAEAALRDGIHAWVPRPEFLRGIDRWTAAQLIDLGLALSVLPPTLEQPFRRLNTLRNRLAHSVGFEFDDADHGAELFASFDVSDQEFLRERIRVDTEAGPDEPTTFPLLRYSIAAIVLWVQAGRKRVVEEQQKTDRMLREIGLRKGPR